MFLPVFFWIGIIHPIDFTCLRLMKFGDECTNFSIYQLSIQLILSRKQLSPPSGKELPGILNS